MCVHRCALCIYVSIRAYIYMSVCECVQSRVNMCVLVYACECMCVCVCLCVCRDCAGVVCMGS